MKNQIINIRSLYDRASQAYYFTGQSIISDAEFDALKRQLRQLSPTDSRLKRVGAPVPADSALKKTKHIIPMGSLNNALDETEFKAWFKKYPGALVASYKMDGASLELIYDGGKLVQAITRGDGEIGEDITANAIMFDGVPPELAEFWSGSIRGECILTTDNWNKIDTQHESNPRNCGNGIMRRKDGQGCHNLTFFAFGLLDGIKRNASARFMKLDDMGFKAAENRLCSDYQAALSFYSKTQNQRAAIPFLIDGVVFELDCQADFEQAGESGGCPKAAIAYKFPPEGAISKVLSVELSVGITGVVFPTANLEPVKIGGATVSRAALCNWDLIAALDVAVGDTVEVVRSGDVIPKIIRVVNRPSNRKPIPAPTKCPSCGKPTKVSSNTDGSDGAAIVCTNPTCPEMNKQKLHHWIKNLDIQGLGDVIVEAMFDQKVAVDAADLYSFKGNPSKLAAVNLGKSLLGSVRATKIIAEIEKKRDLPLNQFFGAIGIDGLGRRRVELIRQAAPGQFDDLNDWFGKKLVSLRESVNLPNAAQVIQDSLNANKPLVDKLIKSDVTISKENKTMTNNTATKPGAKSFCITGTLSKGRAEVQDDIRKAGQIVLDSVKDGLNYLVVADPESGSSKLKRAEKLGVKLISERELYRLLAK